MSSYTYHTFVDPAMQLAREAGEKVMQYYGSDEAVQRGDGSLVTRADRAADDHIVSGLERRFSPLHCIVSEERPMNGRRGDYLWLVDPLDGTSDYLKQTGEFAVQIALVWGVQPIVGVIYLPVSKKMYYGSFTDGAFVEQDGITKELLASARPLNEARLLLSRKDFSDPEEVERIKKQLGVAQVTQAGSFGYKVGLIAEGLADAYINTSPTAAYWDALPAEIILKMAGAVQMPDGQLRTHGGRTTDFDGGELAYLANASPYLPRGAICSNGVFHEELLARAQPFLPKPKDATLDQP